MFVWLGCALEGDTVAITAGVLAGKGLFPLWGAILAAAAGGWTTDLATYYGARYFRSHPRVLRALSHPWAQRMTRRFAGRPRVLCAVFRFIPGARFIAPVLIATATGIRSRTYLPITFCSAMIWGILLVTIGRKIALLVTYVWGHVWSAHGPLVVAGAALVFYILKVTWRYFRSAE
nr:VTT domain-containing protein [Roseivivax marinus]